MCLAAILIDFVIKKDKSYYPQVFLKEYKYIEKELQCLYVYYWWPRNFF